MLLHDDVTSSGAMALSCGTAVAWGETVAPISKVDTPDICDPSQKRRPSVVTSLLMAPRRSPSP